MGCFAITALDTMHNESIFSNAVCTDINQCGSIWFPIVFTPNFDGVNEFFHADSIHSIAKFRLSIFNRWGNVVFKTEDPFFKWDGKDQGTKGNCVEGVYFYEGIVSLFTLKGPIEKKVRGSVTLLR